LRFIDYTSRARLNLEVAANVFSSPLIHAKEHFTPMIYSASAKHRFNDNIMVYFSTGSSWRDSAQTNRIIDGIGAHDTLPWGDMASLLDLKPETSVSYEGGVKTDWFDKKLQVDVTVYHQDFKNYIYSSPNVQVAQRSAIPAGGSLTGPNVGDTYTLNTEGPALASNVPVKVDGVEGDIAFKPIRNWSLAATVSYSMSEIQNGVAPCNLTPPAGGITAQYIVSQTGQQFATCKVNYRAGVGAPFGASIQSEYFQSITENYDGFIRGLITVNGASQNDPSNPYDDIPAYAIANIYAGVRDPHSNWVVTGYVKNLFNTQEVLTRNANQTLASAQVLQPPTFRSAAGVGLPTGFRQVTMTAPQEIGVNFRYQFGSH
jgi:iron complex outermembrane receptor protein